MSIEVGQTLPDATLVLMRDGRPTQVALSELLAGRKVVLFALPGAYTGPCSTIHLPSFIRTADDFRELGVDEIICVAVNDPFVLQAWGESSGALHAGITMAGDPDAELTNALGMAFTAPPIGLYQRSNRYALVLDDGIVTLAHVDEPNECKVSVGSELLDAMKAAA